MKTETFDFLIIGAGIVGCNIAYELSRYNSTIAVIEKNSDVGLEASTNNTGVIHSGYSPPPDTLKAELNVRAVKSFPEVAGILDVPFKKTGKLVIATNAEEVNRLEELFKRAKTNGVKNIKRLKKSQIREMEPCLDGKIEGALYLQDAGIISLGIYVRSVAENSRINGAQFLFNRRVIGIEKNEGMFTIFLKNNLGETVEPIYAKCLINCAGVYADEIAKMAGARYETIYPQKGAYCVLDGSKYMFNAPIYHVPPAQRSGYLGTHITPTIDGRILIGPSGEYVVDKEDKSINKSILKAMLQEAKGWSSFIANQDVISEYAGVRAKITGPDSAEAKDFIIEEDKVVKNFINLIGIDSPGLTCANEIGKYVVGIVKEKARLEKKEIKWASKV